jgi:hypothetical protein
MNKVLERFDAEAIRARLAEAGVLRTLEQRGFTQLDVIVESAGRALPHTLLFGRKDESRFLLLDACVGEAVVRPDFFVGRGYAMERPVELAVVHWVREEDPTVGFTPDRPPLPLQQHPGLGVLRRVFRVVAWIAEESGKDGVVSTPKFFHDALIFFRSRLFLFLDGTEQGRFEALARDLRMLSLGDASLALASGCVRDAQGTIERWAPGYQVFPISTVATAYFHSAQYAAHVVAALNQCRFTVDLVAAAQAREKLKTAAA